MLSPANLRPRKEDNTLRYECHYSNPHYPGSTKVAGKAVIELKISANGWRCVSRLSLTLTHQRYLGSSAVLLPVVARMAFYRSGSAVLVVSVD